MVTLSYLLLYLFIYFVCKCKNTETMKNHEHKTVSAVQKGVKAKRKNVNT